MKTSEVTKQILGIDIGMDSFYVCYKILTRENEVKIKGSKSFKNNKVGMHLFLKWVSVRNKTSNINPLFIMEATGVYYEELAYFLVDNNQQVSVQLAQKIKYYAKSRNLKTKTDRVDAKMIAEYGIEKNMADIDLWIPPSRYIKIIRDLTREHSSIKKSQAAIKNQIHALKHAHKPNKYVVKLKQQQLILCEKQEAKVEKEIKRLISLDKKFANKISQLETIKGLGFITIIKVVCEVNGFLLFKNIAQLVSYTGLDVVQKESGKYVGKTRISKKGNARIRSALYLPALTSMQHNKTLKIYYNRVIEGREIKKQGVIAVMRKLLVLMYTLWKNGQEYDENYKPEAQRYA